QYFGDVWRIGSLGTRAKYFGEPGGITDGDDVCLVGDVETVGNLGLGRVFSDDDGIALLLPVVTAGQKEGTDEAYAQCIEYGFHTRMYRNIRTAATRTVGYGVFSAPLTTWFR